MAYTDIYTAATTDSTLLKQTAVAIKKAAYDISNESEGTTNHAQRMQWMRNVTLTDDAPVKWAKKMIWRVLDNATIQANPSAATDNDVQFVVNSLVDEFAIG